MIPLVNFGRVKELIPILDVLRHEGWSPTWQYRGIMRGGCLIHRSRSPKPRSFLVAGQQWFCHSCRIGGDVVRLWRLLHGHESDLLAALDLCREFRVPVPRK